MCTDESVIWINLSYLMKLGLCMQPASSSNPTPGQKSQRNSYWALRVVDFIIICNYLPPFPIRGRPLTSKRFPAPVCKTLDFSASGSDSATWLALASEPGVEALRAAWGRSFKRCCWFPPALLLFFFFFLLPGLGLVLNKGFSSMWTLLWRRRE